MDSVIRNFRHPVAAYYNRDGSLAFIRFMCFQCTVKSDYEYTWGYSGRNIKEFIQPDTLYYAELTRLPLVTLPDINNPTLFSYVDISAQQFFAKPHYFMGSKWSNNRIYNVSSLSKLYVDGEVISQSFQVLGCFEPVRDYQRKTHISFRSECGRSGEPRLIIFDHTLLCRYITLSTLMRLDGHINVGNINLKAGTVPTQYNVSCCLALEDVRTTTVQDSLGVYSSSLQSTSRTQVNELQIRNDFNGEYLPVPDNIKILSVGQRMSSSQLKGISCPPDMYSCSVVVPSLESFAAPKSCAEFELSAEMPYSKGMFPEIIKPVSSCRDTSFQITGIRDILFDFTGYKNLKRIRMNNCLFKSGTDELVLPVAADTTCYRRLSLDSSITKVRLFKNSSLSDVVPRDVALDFDDLTHDITIIVDCDIAHLSIYGAATDDLSLTVTGKGRVRRGEIYHSDTIVIQNNWGTVNVGSGHDVDYERISIIGCVKNLVLKKRKNTGYSGWNTYIDVAKLKLNEDKRYARDLLITLFPITFLVDIGCKDSQAQYITVEEQHSDAEVIIHTTKG